MLDAAKRNKVADFVTPYNQNGRDFIPWSARKLLESDPVTVTLKPKTKKPKLEEAKNLRPTPPPTRYIRPRVFDHYVMNLPATAIEFLDAFQGIYAGHESLFAPHTAQKLPLIHVYCFSGNSKDELDDLRDICNRISEKIGYTITPEDRVGGSGNQELELEIFNVRLVSSSKQQFCASFRLPREVAFRAM